MAYLRRSQEPLALHGTRSPPEGGGGGKRRSRSRLWRQPFKPSLPSLFLTNARSLTNKMHELKLQILANETVKYCCILLIYGELAKSFNPYLAIELAGYAAQRHDRTTNSGKSKGGGLCMYINNNWCTNTVTVDSHCCPDLEYMTVKCRPFHIPWEFTVVMTTVVYIPLGANANVAIGHLHGNISSQLSKYSDAGQHTGQGLH